jgi:hypothetical protein
MELDEVRGNEELLKAMRSVMSRLAEVRKEEKSRQRVYEPST